MKKYKLFSIAAAFLFAGLVGCASTSRIGASPDAWRPTEKDSGQRPGGLPSTELRNLLRQTKGQPLLEEAEQTEASTSQAKAETQNPSAQRITEENIPSASTQAVYRPAQSMDMGSQVNGHNAIFAAQGMFFKDIQFSAGSTEIPEKGKNIIDRAVADGALFLLFQGDASLIGDKKANIELSRKRVNSVLGYALAKGAKIAGAKIQYRGSTDSSGQAPAANQKVTVVYKLP